MRISKHVSRSVLVFTDVQVPDTKPEALDGFNDWNFAPGRGVSIGNHSAISVRSSDHGQPDFGPKFQFNKNGEDGSADSFPDFLDLIF